MKKFIGGFLLGALLFSFLSINAEGNSLGLIYKDSDVPEDIYISANLCGAEYDICPELLMSIAYYESRYKPGVRNGNCIGLMQVNTKVHKDRLEYYGFTEDDMYDEYKNMIVASDILEELFLEYEDVGAVLTKYNGDTKGYNAYIKHGILPRYATSVLEKSKELEQKHGKLNTNTDSEEEQWQSQE